MKKIIAIFALLAVSTGFAFAQGPSPPTRLTKSGTTTVGCFIKDKPWEGNMENANISLGWFYAGDTKIYPTAPDNIYAPVYPFAAFIVYGGNDWTCTLTINTSLHDDYGLSVTADGLVTDGLGTERHVDISGSAPNVIPGKTTADEGKFMFVLRIKTATMATDAVWGPNGGIHEVLFTGQLIYN
jgi:hypothetical protein